MSKITISYNNKDYDLEFTRQSVRTMEHQGFVLGEITTRPVTMIPMLFAGAFAKNHKGMKRNQIDEIFENISDKTGLMQALIELYDATVASLTEETEGNATWTLVK